MKILSTLTCAFAAAAAMAFCTPSAKAATTSDFSVLSISLTVLTNSGEMTKGSTTTYVAKSVTFHTSDLMHLFESSDFADQKFPSGAKIVVAWDHGRDVVVIDSHNNILYDASTNSTSAYFTVDFDEGDGAYSENEVDTDPGHYDWTDYETGTFTLYDDNDVYIDLFGSGNATYTVNQNWNSHGDYSTYSQSESMYAQGAGIDEDLDDIDDCQIKASITASGSGKGESVLY